MRSFSRFVDFLLGVHFQFHAVEAEKRPLTASEFIARMTGAAQERDEAIGKFNAAVALIAVAATFLGKTSEELQAMKPDALKAALDAKAGAASQADANDKAVKAANDAKALAETNLTAATTQVTAFSEGLAAMKITATAEAGKPLTSANVTAAVNARVNTLAGEKLAELGFPVDGLPPSNNSADRPQTFADKMKHYNTLSVGPERDEYYAKEIAAEFAKPGSN